MMRVSKQFMADFELIISHYGFTEEEVEDYKTMIRRSGNTESTRSIARSIRLISSQPEEGEKNVLNLKDVIFEQPEEEKKSKSRKKR